LETERSAFCVSVILNFNYKESVIGFIVGSYTHKVNYYCYTTVILFLIKNGPSAITTPTLTGIFSMYETFFVHFSPDFFAYSDKHFYFQEKFGKIDKKERGLLSKVP